MNRRSALLCLGTLLTRPAWALYDPKPNALLAPAVGAWRGTLTYVDYQQPDRRVTLQTRLTVSLIGPEELSLYYVFDDGPGKTVYSYERIALDTTGQMLTWTSGYAKPDAPPKASSYRLTLAETNGHSARLQFERAVESGQDRYAMDVQPGRLVLDKQELRSGKLPVPRSRYELTRA